jgi:LPXTG-motif cell wall-anchored protein
MARTKAWVLGLLAASLLVLSAPMALAQEESGTVRGNNNPPEVQADTINPAPDVEGSNNALPFTGADITLFVVIGLAAIGTGIFIVRRTRPQGAS